MQTLDPALHAHLGQADTTLALCWRITRVDGVALGFTQHDCPLYLEGLWYQPAPGFDISKIERTASAAVDNLDVSGAFTNAALTEADLSMGRYNDAQLTIFRVNWADLSMGIQPIASGLIGRVSRRDDAFTAELRGLKHRLGYRATEDYTPDCRAKMGDKRCRVDLSRFTHRVSLTAQTDVATFTYSGETLADGYLDFGQLRYLGGQLVGQDAVILKHESGSLTLSEAPSVPLSFPIDVRVMAGCDRRLETCSSKFGNAANYRGEPHIPGIDNLLYYPGLT
ncbi:MAG: DUF2163 domain-containing protein [Pseudomonadota bacterium]